jgi:hypothetical protein
LNKVLFLLIVVALATSAACQPAPKVMPQPTPVLPSPVPTSTVVVKPGDMPVPTATLGPTVAPKPTEAPKMIDLPVVGEVDCMAGCHIPDPNESLTEGGKPQPANHTGRTACLTCHETLKKPALPSTHVGRLDASCTLCHANPK